MATAHALVEPLFDAAHDLTRKHFELLIAVGRFCKPSRNSGRFAKPSYGGWYWMLLLPFAPYLFQLIELGLGQCVVEAKGNKVRRSLLPPVWQMAQVHCHWLIRVETLKPWWRRKVPHWRSLP